MEGSRPDDSIKTRQKQGTNVPRQNTNRTSGITSEATMYIVSQYASQLQEMEVTINKLRMTADNEKLKVMKNDEAINEMRKKAEEQTISAGLHDADIEEQHRIFEKISDLRNAVDAAQRELDSSEAENKNLEDVIIKLSDDIREVKASLDVIDFQRHKYNKEYEDLSQVLIATVAEREKLVKSNKDIISKFLEEKQKWQSDMRQFKGSNSDGNSIGQPQALLPSSVVLNLQTTIPSMGNGDQTRPGSGLNTGGTVPLPPNMSSTNLIGNNPQSVINMLNGGNSIDMSFGSQRDKMGFDSTYGTMKEGNLSYRGQDSFMGNSNNNNNSNNHLRHSGKMSARNNMSNSFINKPVLPGIGSIQGDSKGGTDDSFSQSFQSELEINHSYLEDGKQEEGINLHKILPQRSQSGFFKGSSDFFDDNDKLMTTPGLYQVMYEILCNTPDVNAGLINFSNILSTENQNQIIKMQQAKVTINKMRTQQTNDNSNKFASKKAEKMLEDINENMKRIEAKQKDLKVLLLTAYNSIAKIVAKFNADVPNIEEIDKTITNSNNNVVSQNNDKFGVMGGYLKDYDENSYPSEDEMLDVIGCVEISINDYMLKFSRSHGGIWNQGNPNQKITQYIVGFPEETAADYINMYETLVKTNAKAAIGNEEPLSGDFSENLGDNDENEEAFGFRALNKIKEHLRHKTKTINELEACMSIKKDDIEKYRGEMMKELNNVVNNDNSHGFSLFGRDKK